MSTAHLSSWRAAHSLLRDAVIADAEAIRRAKPAVRAAQRTGVPDAPYQQGQLARRRNVARAHQLLYGTLRGHSLAEVARGYSPDPGDYVAMLRSWGEVCSAIRGHGGTPPPAPEAIAQELDDLRRRRAATIAWCAERGTIAPAPPELLVAVDGAC